MLTIANAPLASPIKQPGYDRRNLASRIVHLGFGAFYRAHQALMTDQVLNLRTHGTLGAVVNLNKYDFI